MGSGRSSAGPWASSGSSGLLEGVRSRLPEVGLPDVRGLAACANAAG
ncbi:hypothetical protein HMPREF9056_02814 [Actinomyces sp. oral taxon 170 str. F0386]|nr:hypothetical protein HMPREF9056_02814 [Actinomyces sp. oral taxon 170 str. F0386]